MLSQVKATHILVVQQQQSNDAATKVGAATVSQTNAQTRRINEKVRGWKYSDGQILPSVFRLAASKAVSVLSTVARRNLSITSATIVREGVY